jgi:hypothetical protein
VSVLDPNTVTVTVLGVSAPSALTVDPTNGDFYATNLDGGSAGAGLGSVSVINPGQRRTPAWGWMLPETSLTTG